MVSLFLIVFRAASAYGAKRSKITGALRTFQTSNPGESILMCTSWSCNKSAKLDVLSGVRTKRIAHWFLHGREEGGDQNTRFSGVPAIPSTQLPIQTGVSAPTAAGGMVLGPNGGPCLFRT